jgi:hypothetical protein
VPRHPVHRLAARIAAIALATLAAAAIGPAAARADQGGAVVGFTWSPQAPAAGQPVTFTVSPETRAVGLSAALWDFDGDGVFDALGPTVTTTFPAAGSRIVRLVAVDRGGNSGAAANVVTVGPALPPAPVPAPPPPTPAPAPPPSLMSPFPVVRLQGRVLRRGIRVTRLLVQAPAGARVRGVCLGRHRGCPRHSVVRRSRSSRTVVRLRRFERRLRPGAVIQVFVTAPQSIGKYVRFRVVPGRAPSRRDMCVAPAGLAPAHCPGD